MFEKPELAHIHDELMMASLLTLQNEVRANMQSVTTILGGGRNGHLGMVMTPTNYALIPGTSIYDRPPQPTLVLPAGRMQYQIAQAKEQYYNDLCLFDECNTVEKIIIQEVVDTIDSKYLTAICDPAMHQITLSIPEILDHLFDNYSNIMAEKLCELGEHIENSTYQSTEPIDTIFTEIDILSEVAKIAKGDLTEAQKLT
eukprot:13782443-Ditylum_brightwellii.AAC.1